MKTFKEIISSLKEGFNSRITEDSTPEEIAAVKASMEDIDSLEAQHNELESKNAKLKDQIVSMVLTEGSSNQPNDSPDGSNPKTIEECVADELAKIGGK